MYVPSLDTPNPNSPHRPTFAPFPSTISPPDPVDFKEKLIAAVKKEVKQVMEEAVTKKYIHEESCSVTALCAAVEACLSQGLRRRALGLFKTSSTTALLHKVAKVSIPLYSLALFFLPPTPLPSPERFTACASDHRLPRPSLSCFHKRTDCILWHFVFIYFRFFSVTKVESFRSSVLRRRSVAVRYVFSWFALFYAGVTVPSSKDISTTNPLPVQSSPV